VFRDKHHPSGRRIISLFTKGLSLCLTTKTRSLRAKWIIWIVTGQLAKRNHFSRQLIDLLKILPNLYFSILTAIQHLNLDRNKEKPINIHLIELKSLNNLQIPYSIGNSLVLISSQTKLVQLRLMQLTNLSLIRSPIRLSFNTSLRIANGLTFLMVWFDGSSI
jgi:hypothetical protein